MAPEKSAPPCVKDGGLQDSVFLRLRNLPVVSSTYEMVERTYTSTKHTHPIICSVWGVYAKGAKTAGSLAVWTVKPAIHRLEPQIEAVNSLACRGLDRLEEKIPALQYPADKLAADISDAFASAVQSAKQGIAGTIASTSDVAHNLAGGGYKLSWSTVSEGMNYVMNSKPVQMAAEGADTALTLTEHLVNYILPASDEELEEEAPWEAGADGEDPPSQPGYRRLGTLAGTVCRRAYRLTAAQLRRAGSQGRQLVMKVPGVTPLVRDRMGGAGQEGAELNGAAVLNEIQQ